MTSLAEAPELWSAPEKAQAVLKERTNLEREIGGFRKEERALKDARELLDLAKEEGDEAVLEEVHKGLASVDAGLGEMEFARMFSEPNDQLSAIVQINPGSGGTESQDWAEMLLRMYLRYCERRGYKTEIVDILPGEDAGIKSASFTVDAEYAFGALQSEVGVHRLVRISPYDSAARRHTSFASVFVYPQVDDDVEIEIRDEDLRIDTYRAGGAGGQHVNKTESAVRITHLPTNIVVQCQNERSQHKNKSTAMKLLKSRLFERQLKEKEAEMAVLHGQKKEAAFGSQIRSYVLHPYRLVKDHRTACETSNADSVLDGDIEVFIRAFLLQRAKEEAAP